MQEAVQVIEKTAKKWKALKVIGVCVAVAGCVIAVAGRVDENVGVTFTAGVIIAALGAGTAIVGKVCAWWYHG